MQIIQKCYEINYSKLSHFLKNYKYAITDQIELAKFFVKMVYRVKNINQNIKQKNIQSNFIPCSLQNFTFNSNFRQTF